jgi:hypothetical protein
MYGWIIIDVETKSAAAVTEMAAGGSWRHATARFGRPATFLRWWLRRRPGHGQVREKLTAEEESRP